MLLSATKTCLHLVRIPSLDVLLARFASTYILSTIRFNGLISPGKQVLDAVHAYIEYRASGQRKNAVGTKRFARHLDGTRGSHAHALCYSCFEMFCCCVVVHVVRDV